MTDAERGVLVEHVLHAPGDDHAIGGRLRTAHALSATRLTEGQADDLLAGALLLTEGKHRPLRDHMIVAACRGARPERRIREATAYSEVTDDLDLRRAVGDANRRLSRSVARRNVMHLARLDPEFAALSKPLLASL